MRIRIPSDRPSRTELMQAPQPVIDLNIQLMLGAITPKVASRKLEDLQTAWFTPWASYADCAYVPAASVVDKKVFTHGQKPPCAPEADPAAIPERQPDKYYGWLGRLSIRSVGNSLVYRGNETNRYRGPMIITCLQEALPSGPYDCRVTDVAISTPTTEGYYEPTVFELVLK